MDIHSKTVNLIGIEFRPFEAMVIILVFVEANEVFGCWGVIIKAVRNDLIGEGIANPRFNIHFVIVFGIFNGFLQGGGDAPARRSSRHARLLFSLAAGTEGRAGGDQE